MKQLVSYLMTIAVTLTTVATGIQPGTATKVRFTPPPDNASPRRSSNGTSRGGYPSVANSVETVPLEWLMQGLVPDRRYGVTVSERPTIVVYLPKTLEKEVILSLRREDNTLHAQRRVSISGEAGMVAITLPEEVPPLQVGIPYHWDCTFSTQGQLHQSNLSTDGWIRRIESEGAATSTLSLERAIALEKAGVWYDAVATLALLRRAQPDNEAIARHWRDLLDSVGLTAIATAPLSVSF